MSLLRTVLSDRRERPTPALFVDRDGILNRRIVGGYVVHPAQVELLHLALPAIRQARAAGIPVVVVTNQGGIGRGLMSGHDLELVHERLLGLLADHEVGVDAIYTCPHHPQGMLPADRRCQCRKPAPGLFLAAAGDLYIDLTRSMMIGDQPTDAAAARAAGLPEDRIVITGEDATCPGPADTGTALAALETCFQRYSL